jgi:hypothetical protein
MKHKFEMWVLEERPEGADHLQAARCLRAVEFTSDGLIKIEGHPRFNKFPIKIRLGGLEENVAKVVKTGRKFFWVQLQKKSKELSWWK